MPMPDMISRHCVVCGGEQKRVVYNAHLPEGPITPDIVHAQHGEPGRAKWWRHRLVCCLGCGHYYADPVLDPNAVETSYLNQEHDNQFGIDPSVLLKTHLGYAELVRPYLPARREWQVDIGCDTGTFLAASLGLGFVHRVGVEPGREAALRAATLPGVDIRQKLFDPNDFRPGSIQLLTMIHVLDHLVEPVEFIRRTRPLLDSEGVVVTVVHNIKSILARLAGRNWSPISVMHFDYFTPDSLRWAYETAGFTTLKVVRTRNYFPLFHLVRFAPVLPPGLRRVLYRITSGPVLRKVVLGLPLGNIAIIARA